MNTRQAVLLCCCGVFPACTSPTTVATTPSPIVQHAALVPQIVPQPVSLNMGNGGPFIVSKSTTIVVDAGNAEVARVAEQLAALLRSSTGFPIPITSGNSSLRGAIAFHLSADSARSGAEGYQLTVSADSVQIVAHRPAGLFYGAQSLRQLLPFRVESQMIVDPMQWTIPSVSIADRPRYEWRGSMLDVARHFFTVREIKQYIDLLALYKMNVLHLHLADDQGWRIEIKSRPKLVELGSVTQTGGGPGGYFTQNDYAEIVRYARDRYVTIVPEIDMPGHTNAALVAHPEISCSVRAPAPYTGTDVGWSTFCANKEETYAFVNDVVREIAAITPGPYFHMGGDENPILTKDEYVKFVERTQDIVTRSGKRMVGWEEIAQARLQPTSVAQAWRTDSVAAAAVRYGAKVILSPAPRTYLDMMYDSTTELGQKWAALIDMRAAYDWNPATYMKGVTESNILGVEAPIWTETMRNITAVEYMAMPRLPAVAEVAWTPQSAREWESFRTRIASHAPRWVILGINYYKAPQIPW